MTTVEVTWTALKALLAAKGLTLQMDTLQPDRYKLFALDSNVTYICVIYIDYTGITGGDPAQNAIDKADFEANYLPTINQLIRPVAVLYDPAGNPLSVDPTGNLVSASPSEALGTPGFADGYVATSSNSTQVSVRATTYTEQTTNAQRSLVSAKAADAAAGTGARTVRIRYLTDTFTGPFTETVTMNGTTPVNTVATDICYIEELEVLTAGSGGVNAGIITLRAAVGGGGAVVGTIAAGGNKTFWAHHYTPTGSTSFITGISVGHSGTTTGSGGVALLRCKDFSVVNSAERQVSDFVRLFGQSSTFSRNYATPIRVVGPCRTTLYLTPESSSSLVFRASFDFYDMVS